MEFSRIEDALEAHRQGQFVVVVDDTQRENEGDLILPAAQVTPEKIAFMVRHTSGVICVALPRERLGLLRLPQMVSENNEAQRTAFTVSVDYLKGTTTGISAADRATTIQALVDPLADHQEFARPGHVFPLRTTDGGVLRRPGHTEAAADLARLAGFYPAGVLCEIVREDGSMARRPDLFEFARSHGLPIITIADLIQYRLEREALVEEVSTARLPTRHGVFTAHAYRSLIDGTEHLALVKGDVFGTENLLARIHSECLSGDAFGSLRCDCGPQLDQALAMVQQRGRGVVVYLRGHEGRGIGLARKIEAYHWQDQGLDTVEANLHLGLPADARRFDEGAAILKALGVRSLQLLTNNPGKIASLERHGLRVTKRIPSITGSQGENLHYLHTKQEKFGHLLELPAEHQETGKGGSTPDNAGHHGKACVHS